MIVKVKVIVTPRKGILDPQGRATEGALHSLGFDDVKSVSVGRYILLEIDATSAVRAGHRAAQMCDQLLANTLIEDYRFAADEFEVDDFEVEDG